MVRFWRRAGAALIGVGLSGGAMPAHAECLPWIAAHLLVKQNGLLPAGSIIRMVKERNPGQVIQANLCREGAKFLYRIIVLGPKGNLVNLTVDARTGKP